MSNTNFQNYKILPFSVICISDSYRNSDNKTHVTKDKKYPVYMFLETECKYIIDDQCVKRGVDFLMDSNLIAYIV